MRRRLHEISLNSEKLTEELLNVSTKNAKYVAENQILATTLVQLNSKIAKAEELLKSAAHNERHGRGKETTGSVVFRRDVKVEVQDEEDEIVVSSNQLYGDDVE